MMNNFKLLFQSDMARYGEKGAKGFCRKFSRYFRKASTCKNKLLRKYYSFRYQIICKKNGIEIPAKTIIGGGGIFGAPIQYND